MTESTDAASNLESTPPLPKSKWRVWLFNVAVGVGVIVLGLNRCQ